MSCFPRQAAAHVQLLHDDVGAPTAVVIVVQDFRNAHAACSTQRLQSESLALEHVRRWTPGSLDLARGLDSKWRNH